MLAGSPMRSSACSTTSIAITRITCGRASRDFNQAAPVRRGAAGQRPRAGARAGAPLQVTAGRGKRWVGPTPYLDPVSDGGEEALVQPDDRVDLGAIALHERARLGRQHRGREGHAVREEAPGKARDAVSGQVSWCERGGLR